MLTDECRITATSTVCMMSLASPTTQLSWVELPTATTVYDSTTTDVRYSQVNKTNLAICCSGGVVVSVIMRPMMSSTHIVIDLTLAQSSRHNAPSSYERHRLSLVELTHRPLTRAPPGSPLWDRKWSWSRKWRSMTKHRAPGGCS